MVTKLQKIIVSIIAVSFILFAGFLIGRSCESYCVTCNGYNLFPITSILGVLLLVFGLRLIVKAIQDKKHKMFLFVFLLVYSLLLFAFGMYVSYSSTNELLEMYKGYQEGIVIEKNTINIIILLFSSFTLCYYSTVNLYKEYANNCK